MASLFARAFSRNHATTANYTLARVSLSASGTLNSPITQNTQGTLATIDPRSIMVTNNMADQNIIQQPNAQTVEVGGATDASVPEFTQDEMDAFTKANPDLFDLGME